MPSIAHSLIAPLRDTLNLVRGIETGTYQGDGLRRLAHLPEAKSIELSPYYCNIARAATADLPNTEVLFGHSVEWIPRLVDSSKRTLWFLDGHWSTGDTAGIDDQCPVLREILGMAGSHPDDVIVVDDARFCLLSPPPGHSPEWPTLVQLTDALRAVQPDHFITLINDQIIAVPPRARHVLDRYAVHPDVRVDSLPVALRSVARAIKYRKLT